MKSFVNDLFQDLNLHSINRFRVLFSFVAVFFFIFSPRLDLKIVIHTGFISVLLIVFLVTIRQHKIFFFPKQLLFIAMFFCGLALYHSIFAFFYDNNASHFSSICISVIISIVFGWLLASYLFNNESSDVCLIDHLLMMCTISAILNSSVILIEYIFPEVKLIIEGFLVQVQDANINYAEHAFRLRGLASAGGAGLSVFNAVIIIFIVFLVIRDKFSSSLAIGGAIILACSNVFAGRTGLILGIFFTFILLAVVLVKNFRSGFYGILRALCLTSVFLLLLTVLVDFDLDPEAAGWAFEWVDGIGSGKLESGSVDELGTMIFLPDNPIHLMFGVGFFEGIGKIYSRSDSGYLKTILSIGVPLGIGMYSVIIFMFFKVSKVSSKYFWLVLSVSIVMLFVEIKEPFLYQNYVARAIFLLSGAAMFILAKRRVRRNTLIKSAYHVS
jgi:hypothetical protein